MKDQQKCRLTGPTTGCFAIQVSCIEEKHTTSCKIYLEKQTNKKQVYIYTYTQVCTIVWGARANQRHTRHHRSSRVYVRVSWCLYVQFWGAIHVQQAFDVRSNTCHIHAYVHTRTHIQHFHSSTALCKKPRETHTLTEAMKARQKFRLAGPTTGCYSIQDTCIEEKQRVRQTAVVYTQKSKQTTYIYTHTHTHIHKLRKFKFVCVLSMCNKHLIC